LITLQQGAEIGSFSLPFMRKLTRKRKRGEGRCPFKVLRFGRAIRIVKSEFLECIHRGIDHV
jgi:hypothetical protein